MVARGAGSHGHGQQRRKTPLRVAPAVVVAQRKHGGVGGWGRQGGGGVAAGQGKLISRRRDLGRRCGPGKAGA